jgi:hypothetical protein
MHRAPAAADRSMANYLLRVVDAKVETGFYVQERGNSKQIPLALTFVVDVTFSSFGALSGSAATGHPLKPRRTSGKKRGAH